MERIDQHKKVILAVDDAPENLDVLREILTPKYALKVATNGPLALRISEKTLPDLILLDVVMPEMDGYEVCRQLKANPITAAIPVIFVTAMGQSTNEAEGFHVGAVDYIAKPIEPITLQNRVKTHLSLVATERLDMLARSAIRMLGEAGHYNDTDTGEHIWRMAAYSRAIAEAMGMSRVFCESLELAAPLHDTGKIGIPDSILKAPRKLTADEWTIMKTHSQIGYEILSQSDNPVFKLAATIALNHHERWDGSGYPNGLVGDNIPVAARIVAIADVFDALTMSRPYKQPWTIDAALAEISQGAGSHFDRDIVETFVKIKDRVISIRDHWNEKEQ